jgi:hypothetical protein
MVVVCFKISQDNRFSGREPNLRHFDFELGELTTTPRYSFPSLKRSVMETATHYVNMNYIGTIDVISFLRFSVYYIFQNGVKR